MSAKQFKPKGSSTKGVPFKDGKAVNPPAGPKTDLLKRDPKTGRIRQMTTDETKAAGYLPISETPEGKRILQGIELERIGRPHLV